MPATGVRRARSVHVTGDHCAGEPFEIARGKFWRLPWTATTAAAFLRRRNSLEGSYLAFPSRAGVLISPRLHGTGAIDLLATLT